ncbi:DUF3108 domain-containing protein [Xanthobacter pseudotagetidis]|uniref:DUF3108 domain-containing protein n=1 Tax=Xanthobacter pseudotagetidis TaxID=3119911 RepID=UPI003726BB2A
MIDAASVLSHARLVATVLALAPLALALGVDAARADGRMVAKYSLSVAGVEFGRGTFVVQASDSAYEISGTARITGLMRAVANGKGRAAARGALAGGRMVPRVYAMDAEADGKEESARIVMAAGAVKEMDVEPELKFYPDRVPVTDAVLKSVLDPVSGAFVYMAGTADMLSAAACQRVIPVFDGRQRYDIALTFQRIEQVKVEGYSGPAVVCGARYKPVAGHRPSRYTVKYMQDNKDVYAWLVPIAGTRLMAPFRVSVATMIGTAVLEAEAMEMQAVDGTLSVSAPKP